VRRFCRWLVTEGELDIAPTGGIGIPTPPEKPVPILSDEEITALLKTCTVPRGRPGAFDRAVFLGRCDEVILRLLLDTGVRVSELCGLDLLAENVHRQGLSAVEEARGVQAMLNLGCPWQGWPSTPGWPASGWPRPPGSPAWKRRPRPRSPVRG
jgi:site-specific recombinase XerC